jgi:hypothetical protein
MRAEWREASVLPDPQTKRNSPFLSLFPPLLPCRCVLFLNDPPNHDPKHNQTHPPVYDRTHKHTPPFLSSPIQLPAAQSLHSPLLLLHFPSEGLYPLTCLSFTFYLPPFLASEGSHETQSSKRHHFFSFPLVFVLVFLCLLILCFPFHI